MGVTIFFINTITGLEKGFNALCDELIKTDTVKKHISDESLIFQIMANGGITKSVRRRFLENVVAAEEAGADIIQVTCSSVTPLIEDAGTLVDIPVLSIDEPMARIAVSRFEKLGVIATNPGTLLPSAQLLEKTAEKAGRKIDLKKVLCGRAYDALLSGSMELHDRLVIEDLKKLMKQCDAVVLAQASMARVADMIDDAEKPAVLFTSPRLAIEHLAEVISCI